MAVTKTVKVPKHELMVLAGTAVQDAFIRAWAKATQDGCDVEFRHNGLLITIQQTEARHV